MNDTNHKIDEAASSHTPGPWMTNGTSIRKQLDSGLTEKLATVHGGQFGMRADTAHANARLIASSPSLLAFAARIARMIQDGEEMDGREFLMENDDAVATLNALIDEARGLVAEAKGLAA